MGRVVSAVIGLAESNGSSVRLTQMLRVPLKGLTKAMNLPSGEICAPEISGSPKNSSRSITGGRPFCCADALAAYVPRMSVIRATMAANEKQRRNFESGWNFMRTFLLDQRFDWKQFDCTYGEDPKFRLTFSLIAIRLPETVGVY